MTGRLAFQSRCVAAAIVAAALVAGGSAQARQGDRGREGRDGRESPQAHSDIAPYLEVGQVVSAEFNNGGEVLTYSVVAAGVDARIATNAAEAQVNLRYERRIGWGDNVGDQDILSGIGRARLEVVPGALSIEGGALATRSRIDLRGAAPSNLVGGSDNVTQVYSLYAGPTLATHVGSLSVDAAYRIGYTKVDYDTVVLAPGATPIDQFDDSVSQAASVAVGQQPGELPFGWSASAGYAREDAGQLDQRFEDKFVRADVTVPISYSVALLGGMGYENVEVSERDALRDGNGDPVVGSNGRLVTDPDSPRRLAFDADGLIWDVGVLWRPSRRTSLEAHVGRRYGSMSYTGTFSYRPSARTAMGLAVYDRVSGFGSLLNDNLAALPTEFSSSRNPLSGDLNPCMFGNGGSQCFNDLLQSVASSAFRSRGVTGYFTTTTMDGWRAGLALGYNRRRFFASETGALAGFDGVIDETWFANVSLQKQIDARSRFDANFYANYLDSGLDGGGNVLGVGANAAYYRNLARRLTGTFALGVDGYDPEGFDSAIFGSALVGLRYDF